MYDLAIYNYQNGGFSIFPKKFKKMSSVNGVFSVVCACGDLRTDISNEFHLFGIQSPSEFQPIHPSQTAIGRWDPLQTKPGWHTIAASALSPKKFQIVIACFQIGAFSFEQRIFFCNSSNASHSKLIDRIGNSLLMNRRSFIEVREVLVQLSALSPAVIWSQDQTHAPKSSIVNTYTKNIYKHVLLNTLRTIVSHLFGLFWLFVTISAKRFKILLILLF